MSAGCTEKTRICYCKPLDTATDRSVLPFQETVLYSDEAARKAHRGLFSLQESSYRQVGDDVLGDIERAVAEQVARLHVVLSWEALLSVAAWSHGRPAAFDVFSLLKKAGLTDTDLAPFAKSDLSDLLPWLYYGKRIDVLRKVCTLAKTKIETRLAARRVQIYCHLVGAEPETIVASSL